MITKGKAFILFASIHQFKNAQCSPHKSYTMLDRKNGREGKGREKKAKDPVPCLFFGNDPFPCLILIYLYLVPMVKIVL